jgi:hypothetical protein
MPLVPHGWRRIADSLQAVEGMPWEFPLAVAIHESGWGTSAAVFTHNNPLGIKRHGHIEHFPSISAAFESLAYRFSGRHASYMTARTIYLKASTSRKGGDGLTREFLDAFGRVYCPTDTKVWVDDVEALINQLRVDEAMRIAG